ncbi:MAG: monofunctional biosynthetic peptidoglycan transglycosylase [Chromatiaceae bacterium]|nr:MAG: monofunctional biosynthetic peptidoglycan transglycosylase [Chromatiaceae bacterium]
MPKTRRSRLARLLRALLWLIFTAALASVALVALLRWVDPPTSAFMLRHRLSSQWQGQAPPYLYHEWVALADLPAVVPLAVIAAEDQRFPNHRGFDLVEMRQAWARHRAGGRLRGASTISQQTAKNLFLWPGRDWLRKGLEAWFTQWIEWLWPKRRILEIYLNIAQFSPDTYGVGAASWRYFNRPAVALERRQAALLAAVLPNPEIYRLEAPSPQVQRRVAWIETQMRQLGGTGYLQRL